jgi:two-component system sensor histidine kinase HydH
VQFRGYNLNMSNELFAEMKRYLVFGEIEARLIASLRTRVSPHFPEIVIRFYKRLDEHPGARAVLRGDPGMIARLQKSLLVWLEELFSGTYDDSYFHSRCRIGRTHVRVELPQHYMFMAMNLIRLELTEHVERLNLSENETIAAVAALQKLLDLELAIMNQTYREDLVRKMQELERSQYEQRISEAEHLASIGQLAASLAHEIKNPLAGISGAIQVLGNGLGLDHPHREIISEALRQIDRLDAAVKDLLIYARPKPPEKVRVDLVEVIGHALVLLREEPAFRDVRVLCDGMDEPCPVMVDESQLHQVITNLLLNAAHACERGGTVRCAVKPVEAMVRLTVADDGCGMPSDVLVRVFEPFYTTKSRGTGLGLSICKRIVEAHNGAMDIESRVGKGTRVTVEIPAGL